MQAQRRSLARFRTSIISRVIPGPGCDAQGSGAVERLNPNGVVKAGRVRIRRAVTDHVLTPDVSRDRRRDRLHLVETGWKKCRASGLLGESAQRSPETVIWPPPSLLECDRVEDGSVLRLQLVENVLERSLARVVVPVGYQQNNLLLQRGSFVQVIDGSNESIVEGGAASRVHPLESCS